jgi:glycosyltransferase involved in cell wall biosynthesis
MRQQILPGTTSLEIVLVDDGSNDGTAELLASDADETVRVVQLVQNSGRSAARNTGARESRGTVLVFMDSDCLPAGNEVLRAHLEALRQGNIASTGHVFGSGGDFWDRYQRDASSLRERRHRRGCSYAGSSQNLAVVRSAFEEVGGFNIRYRRYGFEDRDLLLRLGRLGSIAWPEEASVHHMDSLTLAGFCEKMIEAGESSSAIFALNHPSAYKELGYAALDARSRRWLGPVGRSLGPHILGLARDLEPSLRKSWLPYVLQKGIVRAASAVSFIYGTTRAQTHVGMHEKTS